MKTDFMLAISQLAAEKNLPRDVVLSAVETALASAYKKGKLFSPEQTLAVKVNTGTGEVRVFVRKTVVEDVQDSKIEMSLEDAQKMNTSAALGETVDVEFTPANAGRIAAQTARQVILQRLHEAEHNAVFEEYSGKEGDVVVGTVQRMEPRQVLVDIGHAEAILPASEQAKNERYRIGQRLRVYVLEVARTGRGPQVIVSRAHRNLLRRLFELEIPEIYNDAVEIKSVAREAGQRSKVAVAARQEGIDPVGCCVGLRGIRIQSIVNELGGERIDVMPWHADPSVFIANALSPAQITSVELNEADRTATVVVPDRQLSLAIGREGQNARLAARLTGWRIDIKAASVSDAKMAEKLSVAQKAATLEEAEKVVSEAVAGEKAVSAEPEAAPEPAALSPVEAPVVAEVAAPAVPAEAAAEMPFVEPAAIPSVREEVREDEPIPLEVALARGEIFAPPKREATSESGQIRFAEDVLGWTRGRKAGPGKADVNRGKKSKKSKGGPGGSRPKVVGGDGSGA